MSGKPGTLADFLIRMGRRSLTQRWKRQPKKTVARDRALEIQ